VDTIAQHFDPLSDRSKAREKHIRENISDTDIFFTKSQHDMLQALFRSQMSDGATYDQGREIASDLLHAYFGKYDDKDKEKQKYDQTSTRIRSLQWIVDYALDSYYGHNGSALIPQKDPDINEQFKLGPDIEDIKHIVSCVDSYAMHAGVNTLNTIIQKTGTDMDQTATFFVQLFPDFVRRLHEINQKHEGRYKLLLAVEQIARLQESVVHILRDNAQMIRQDSSLSSAVGPLFAGITLELSHIAGVAKQIYNPEHSSLETPTLEEIRNHQWATPAETRTHA
jgi:hypothetical protein